MLWRRFLILSDSTRIRKKDYAVPRLGGLGCHDARKITLSELHFRINERFLYEYDFCDLWQHQVRFEKRLEIEASRSYPVCVCVCGRSMGRATGGLRETASVSGPARVRSVASERAARRPIGG
ncbi:MAG: hypothetical protein WCA06_14795, partial [Terrimicrobiaceae bacterium]